MKPKLFVGSSTEALKVAYAIQESLECDALCTVWKQGIFDLSGNALDNLLNAVERFDFAIFIFQPDDVSRIREETVRTVRDNVIFELGLFVSRLGKERVYFLVPKDSEEIHMPTDLLGVKPGHYTPPEKDDDLLAALGPFCNQVRRRIEDKGEFDKSLSSEKASISGLKSETLPHTNVDGIELETKKSKHIENGVTVDDFGNFTISEAPTVFFAHRMSKSFPGIRGLEWFTNPKQALDRLEILLRNPILFEKSNGYGVTRDPIWWFRGGRAFYIDSFARLTETRCLMDIDELEIDRLAIFHSSSYYQSFVYVEVQPDQPIGIYKTSAVDIQRMVESFGYAYEEYGIYQNTPITRACYDDGAAVIDGTVTDTSGAQLRGRYLSRYNFLITSKFSPINTKAFDIASKPLLNGILLGEDRFNELFEMIERLPRHDGDY